MLHAPSPPCALRHLGAGLLLVLVMAAGYGAAPAHARWVTAQGSPPIFSDTQVCRNGMAWRFADVDRPGRGSSFLLPPLVITTPPAADFFDPEGNPLAPRPETILLSRVLRVPRDRITVPVDQVGGTSENFPTEYEYSGAYVFQFPRLVPDGPDAVARVGLDWGSHWSYLVADCRLVDVDPGRFPNRVRPDRGYVRIALVTTPGFDATLVPRASARLGQDTQADRWSTRDVDGDGDRDKVLGFRASETGVACGDTSIALEATGPAGEVVRASDEIEPVCPD